MQEEFERQRQRAREALHAREYAYYFTSRSGRDELYYFGRLSPTSGGIIRLYYRVARWFQLQWPEWVALD